MQAAGPQAHPGGRQGALADAPAGRTAGGSDRPPQGTRRPRLRRPLRLRPTTSARPPTDRSRWATFRQGQGSSVVIGGCHFRRKAFEGSPNRPMYGRAAAPICAGAAGPSQGWVRRDETRSGRSACGARARPDQDGNKVPDGRPGHAGGGAARRLRRQPPSSAALPSIYLPLANNSAHVDVDAARDMISSYRRNRGAPPLTVDPELQRLAEAEAAAMALADRPSRAQTVKGAVERLGYRGRERQPVGRLPHPGRGVLRLAREPARTTP